MNKSISISLGGFSFFIEEDAYQKLYQYLEEVKDSLQTEDDVEEIIKDVESRIAELFKEGLGNFRQVIDIKDVTKMIEIMGTPEQYHSENDETEKNKNTSHTRENKKFYQKQLFRDVDDKVLGGVCSGLSHFFGIQATWFRLGLVIVMILMSFIGLGKINPFIIFLYIILWIVVPKATTTSDKLQMKGKPVTFDSIKEYINKDEVYKHTNKLKNKVSAAGNEFGNLIEKILKICIRIIALLIGFLFTILGLTFILSYFIAIFSIPLTSTLAYDYINLFIESQWQLYASLILIGIIIIIPSFFLSLVGLRLLTERTIIKTSVLSVITTWVIWFFAIIAFFVLLSTTAIQYNNKSEKSEKYIINTTSDTLHFNITDNATYETYFKSDKRKIYGINIDAIKFTKDSILKKINKNLTLKPSLDQNTYLELIYTATGKDENAAYSNISGIHYSLPKINGNTINLNSYFSLPKNSKYRNQEVDIVLYLPKDKYLNAKNTITLFYKDNIIYKSTKQHNTINNPNILIKFDGECPICISCDGFTGRFRNNGFDALDFNDLQLEISKDKNSIRIKTKKDSAEINIKR